MKKEEERDMKIFILKPSERWDYCGGGRVVIANNFNDVKKMFDKDELIESEEEKTKEDWHVWVKVEELKTDETESRIILDNYNWA